VYLFLITNKTNKYNFFTLTQRGIFRGLVESAAASRALNPGSNLPPPPTLFVSEVLPL